MLMGLTVNICNIILLTFYSYYYLIMSICIWSCFTRNLTFVKTENLKSEYVKGNLNGGSIHPWTFFNLCLFLCLLFTQSCVTDTVIRNFKEIYAESLYCVSEFPWGGRWGLQHQARRGVRGGTYPHRCFICHLIEFICLVLSLPSYFGSPKMDCFHC